MKRALAVLLLGAAASARAELVDRVAAVVNNEVIALSEVEQRALAVLADGGLIPPLRLVPTRRRATG